jgi:hypothetical protein
MRAIKTKYRRRLPVTLDDAVGRRHTQCQRNRGRGNREKKAVQRVETERTLLEDLDKIVERGLRRHKDGPICDVVHVWLECQRNHPEEHEQYRREQHQQRGIESHRAQQLVEVDFACSRNMRPRERRGYSHTDRCRKYIIT